MSKTIETKVYTYAELLELNNGPSIDAARHWFINAQFEDTYWFEGIKDEATALGIKIDSFDCDRGNNISGSLTKSAYDVAAGIKIEHGEKCGTYKVATAFMLDLNVLENRYKDKETSEENQDTFNAAKKDLEMGFEKDILEEYLALLKNEVKYIQSDENIAEGMEANEYHFTVAGRRFG